MRWNFTRSKKINFLGREKKIIKIIDYINNIFFYAYII